MNNELIELAKKCKSADEIIALGKEKGIEIPEGEAQAYFAMLNKQNSELADSELASVSAGGCGGQLYYPEVDGGYLKVFGLFNTCDLYEEDEDAFELTIPGTCYRCKHHFFPRNTSNGASIGACRIRREGDDPCA